MLFDGELFCSWSTTRAVALSSRARTFYEKQPDAILSCLSGRRAHRYWQAIFGYRLPLHNSFGVMSVPKSHFLHLNLLLQTVFANHVKMWRQMTLT